MADESIREQIVANAATALAAINGSGDYHTALETIARSQLVPRNLDALPATHVREGEERIVDGPDPLITRILSLHVLGWIAREVDEPDALATMKNRLQADIERAVLTDPTRGGLAVNTRVAGSPAVDDLEADHLGAVQVDFEVLYRTRTHDPAQGL